jgi:hypothetical protein
MTYATRELTADELDLVSGGSVKEIHIGPITITAGKGVSGGVLGIRVDGVIGVLGTSGPNGAVEGFVGKHSGMV